MAILVFQNWPANGKAVLILFEVSAWLARRIQKKVIRIENGRLHILPFRGCILNF